MRDRIIMLEECFILFNSVVLFERIQQIERHCAVVIIVPYLHKIDPGIAVKERVVEIESLLLPKNLIRISK